MPNVRDIHRGRIVHLTEETVDLPNGHRVELEIVRHPGASAVAALNAQGEVTLLRQYRHAVGGYLWEVPAGKLDPGEAPLACAARELREEAGVEAGRLEPVGSIVTCPGFCDEVIHLFVATALRSVPQALGADEVIDDVRSVPLAEAMAMIGRGEIRDGKTIAALVQTDLRYGRGASGEQWP
ncbi:MAG TPA: NUDIX hydrolase [Candidatus Binatia bacterium]|jgi:ADP-ribose pyrophosphatase